MALAFCNEAVAVITRLETDRAENFITVWSCNGEKLCSLGIDNTMSRNSVILGLGCCECESAIVTTGMGHATWWIWDPSINQLRQLAVVPLPGIALAVAFIQSSALAVVASSEGSMFVLSNAKLLKEAM